MQRHAAIAAALLLLPGAAAASPQPPRFDWATVGGMVFHHSSSPNRDYQPDQLKGLARFPLVVVEKWQAVHQTNDSRDEEQKIIAACRGVKAVNSNVSCIFYYNSVCNFPQYTLNSLFAAQPGLTLDFEFDCAGFKGPTMRPYNFSNPTARALYAEECANATASGVVDGCFVDRAVDGAPSESKAGPGYTEGHKAAILAVQQAIGPSGVVIANHMCNAPDKYIDGVSGCMFEGFGANEKSLLLLQAAAAKGKVVQAHGGNDDKSLATFLLGAGRLSYFGTGGWNGDDGAIKWDARWDLPLGAPAGPAVKTGDVWERHFSTGTVVTANFASGAFSINWSGTAPPTPAPPAPPLPPPPPPGPAPTQHCGQMWVGGNAGNDIGSTKTDDWASCCEWCGNNTKCVAWTWYSDGKKACHGHKSLAGRNDITGRISGVPLR